MELDWKGCKMGTLRKMGVVLLYFVLVACVANAADQALVGELNLAEDTTARLTVRELRISGNTLVSTSDLLDFMPAVFNTSTQPLTRADSQFLYDLTVIREIVANPGIPRQVSIRTIQGLTQYILSVYQKNDYSGIFVYVPEGALTDGQLRDGILPIIVLEAPVSDVKIKYYNDERKEVEEGYLRSSAIEQWSPIERNKVASQRALDYLVNLLNLNPDRHVSAVVSRAEEPNSLAIEYNIYETNPWHFFIQADNSGTSDRQWSPRIGLINTNLLGYDDRFTTLYQFAADSTFDENYSVFGSYDFPVAGPRLRLNLYGGYSEFDINPESGPFNFLGSGDFYGAVLRYNLLQDQGWFFDVLGSWSHEESTVDPRLLGLSFNRSDVEMDMLGVGASLYRRDDMTNTSLSINRVESIGKTDATEFNLARTNAEPDFSIITAAANHSQYLDIRKVQQLRTTIRWVDASDRLVPAKMTSFGGMYSVRGYDEYEIVADGGILASIQYEFDLIRHGQSVDSPVITNEEVKKLAPLVFADFGRTTIEDPVAGDPDVHDTLISVGAGTAFEIGNNFSAALYYGYPLKATEDTRRGKGRLNASAMLRW